MCGELASVYVASVTNCVLAKDLFCGKNNVLTQTLMLDFSGGKMQMLLFSETKTHFYVNFSSLKTPQQSLFSNALTLKKISHINFHPSHPPRIDYVGKLGFITPCKHVVTTIFDDQKHTFLESKKLKIYSKKHVLAKPCPPGYCDHVLETGAASIR